MVGAVGVEITSLSYKSRKRNDIAPPPFFNWSLLEPSRARTIVTTTLATELLLARSASVGGYAGSLPEKQQQDDPNNDKHASQDAHVDLVLLRRKQTLRDRCALPEPPLKNIRFD